MEATKRLVVYKFREIDDEKGIVKPVLFIDDENNFQLIDSSLFPTGILISKGYSYIEDKYEDGQLFILNEINKDEQKSLEDGIDRYWAFGRDNTSLSPSTLMPIISCKLPPIETGKIPDNIKIPQGIFFIWDKEDHKLYGPARAIPVPDESYYEIEAAATPKLSFGQGHLGMFDTRELESVLIELVINNQNFIFLSSLNDLSNYRYNSKDYISDRALVRYFSKYDFGRNLKSLSRKEAEKLSTSVAKAEKIYRNKFSQSERLERFKKILDRYLNEEDIGYKIINDYFSTAAGDRFLKKYVESNQKKLLGENIASIKAEVTLKENELKQNLFKLEGQISTKQEELNSIHIKVKKAKELADEEIQADMKNRYEKLQESINKLEIEKEQKTKELDDVCKNLNIANNLEEMERKDIYLQENNKRLEAAAKGFQEQLQNTDDLAKRISEYHVIGQVLKGADVTKEALIKYESINFVSDSFKPSSASNLIDKIRSHLDWDGGKSFSNVELSNIMLCLSQSFLTVLSGPPGVGKTSTVIRLAQALKLGAPDEHKNFLYMPVSRGWVSSRDILGFHNSLTGVYQRARTGLYDFLRREDEGVKALQLILLDESNLSPMEHYWADFLGMCDKEGRNRPIDTGIPHDRDRFLHVGENVRFIATINHDSTTERLSPRLIDRVPIISIDHEDDIDYSYETDDLTLDGTVDYKLIQSFFNILKETENSDFHSGFLNRCIEILGDHDINLGQSIIISHRKRAAINRYFSIAIDNELMEAETAEDFALSQYVLPHIEGYGSKFKNRIENLSEFLGKRYPRSQKHIERILLSGNDFTGTYSFF